MAALPPHHPLEDILTKSSNEAAARRISLIRRGVAVAALSAACAGAIAAPVTLAANEAYSFNFDATSLLPIASVGFDAIVTDFSGPIGGAGTFADQHDGVSSIAGCASSGDFTTLCLDLWRADFTNPGLLDGIFSFTVRFNGPVTVDVIALVRDASGDLTRLREIGDTTTFVPEPGSLALAALALSAACLAGRRTARRPK